MKSTSKTAILLPTYIGAALGLVSFLWLGAVPGALYGGYMGLIMAGSLFGTPVEPTMVARIITGGGMVLGLVATLFLFLVVGAVLGTLAGVAVRPIARALAHHTPVEATNESR